MDNASDVILRIESNSALPLLWSNDTFFCKTMSELRRHSATWLFRKESESLITRSWL